MTARDVLSAEVSRLSVSVISWLGALGIAFIVDDAHHARASVGVHTVHGHAPWFLIPLILSIGGAVAGLFSVIFAEGS